MSTNLLLRFSFFTCHLLYSFIFFFFFNDTATTEIYTLSLHDALPISSEPRQRDHGNLGLRRARIGAGEHHEAAPGKQRALDVGPSDREDDERGEQRQERQHFHQRLEPPRQLRGLLHGLDLAAPVAREP